MRELLARLLRTGWTGRRDRGLDDEVEFHLDQLAAEHRRRGLDPAAARDAAARDFGGAARIKQAWRDQRALPAADDVLQDIRYGWRVLCRSRGLTLVAGLTLAVAVAATTSVFAVMDAVLLAPLPYGRADRLCVLYERYVPQDADRVSVAPGTFLEWQDRTRAFAALTAIDTRQQNLTSNGEPRQVVIGAVSQGFARTVEVQPSLGRSFDAGEFQPGRERVVLLGHGLWTTRFGGSAEILGKPVTVDDHAYVVIGVMPPAFMFPDPAIEAWVPMPATAGDRGNASHTLFAVARLRDGASLRDGAADLHRVARELKEQSAASYGDWLALGAAPVAVARLVLASALRAALIGIAAGLMLILALGRSVASLLADVEPADAATLTIVAAALTTTVLLACWLPARRAVRVDPMEALRAE